MLTSQTLAMISDRPSLIEAFIKTHNLTHLSCKFLAGDASLRKYYRLGIPPNSFVVMDAPAPENPEQFERVALFLRESNLSAPEIHATDHSHGLMLLEDFGDTTYSKILTPQNTESLYTLAVDTLITLHQRIAEKPSWLAEYTVTEYLREALIFIEWYYPQHHKGAAAPTSVRASFIDCWQEILETTLEGPKSLILRDYHVDNLVLLSERNGINQCGLLDFQDALWGSVTYDLVSLLEDARRDVDDTLAENLWQRYVKAFPTLDYNESRRIGTILSAARHTKIIGIFTRLCVRDGKTHYLQHLPRLWRLLAKCLQHQDLQKVKTWFDVNIPGWDYDIHN